MADDDISGLMGDLTRYRRPGSWRSGYERPWYASEDAGHVSLMVRYGHLRDTYRRKVQRYPRQPVSRPADTPVRPVAAWVRAWCRHGFAKVLPSGEVPARPMKAHGKAVFAGKRKADCVRKVAR